MTQSEVEAMLDTLADIKAQQPDENHTDSVGTVEEGDCFACGSGFTKRVIVAGSGSNRTAGRYVGGRNMRMLTECRDCGNRWSR